MIFRLNSNISEIDGLILFADTEADALAKAIVEFQKQYPLPTVTELEYQT